MSLLCLPSQCQQQPACQSQAWPCVRLHLIRATLNSSTNWHSNRQSPKQHRIRDKSRSSSAESQHKCTLRKPKCAAFPSPVLLKLDPKITPLSHPRNPYPTGYTKLLWVKRKTPARQLPEPNVLGLQHPNWLVPEWLEREECQQKQSGPLALALWASSQTRNGPIGAHFWDRNGVPKNGMGVCSCFCRFLVVAKTLQRDNTKTK